MARTVSERLVHQCQCPICQASSDPPVQALHSQTNLYLSRLDEQQRRWYVALEAKKLGHGGTKTMSLVTGMHVNTIRRGRRELDQGLASRVAGRIRSPGGGRLALEKNT
jgi:hypothetical protein